MDDLSFLSTPGEPNRRNAILKAVLMDGRVRLISEKICPYVFLDKCPLLYHAFEYGMHGRLQASVEVPSETALISLLRYCYTGSYLPSTVDDGKPLLLPHVEMYKMAEDFDIPELQLLAHGNFSCHIELACCVPATPQDLIQTIYFLYRHYPSKKAREQHGLVSTLLNYVVSRFLDLELGSNAAFVKVATDIPEFCQDLCCTNMERNFGDDCAFAIIRLCPDSLRAPSYAPALSLASEEALQDPVYGDGDYGCNQSQIGATFHVVPTQATETLGRGDMGDLIDSVPTPLAHRPKIPHPIVMDGVENASSEDEEGFTLVLLPKSYAPATPGMLMSGSEVAPTPVVAGMAAVRTEYISDDDWAII